MLAQGLKRNTYITIALAALGSILIICIPFVDINGSTAQKVGSYILAALFWISVIAECVFVYLSAKERKKLERSKFRYREIKNFQPGIISFFKNKEALIADIVMFAFAAVAVILFLAMINVEWLIIGSVSILFLSFNLHCILNGKNYRYLKIYTLYKKEHERYE